MPTPKPGEKENDFVKLRSGIARGIEENGIDKENNIIHGFSVISEGEAQGHNLEIDKKTLEQVVEKGNSAKNGLKSRFGHPNMSHSAFGTFLGRAKDFRLNDDRVRADLHIDKTAFDSPKGNLGKYVIDLAESDPAAFGASIVFELEREYRINEDGTPKQDENGEDLLPLARVKTLYAADVVDQPATGDELFEFFTDSVQPSAEATKIFNNFLQQPDSVNKVCSFMERYVDNEEQKQLIINQLGRVVSMKEDKKENIKNHNYSLSKEESVEETKEKTSSFTEAQLNERAELATQLEKERVAEIYKSCEVLKVKKEFAQDLIDKDISLEDARKKIIEEGAKGFVSVDTVKVSKDEQDASLEGMSNALLIRSALEKDPKIISDVRKSKFKGLSLKKLVASCLSNDGETDAFMLDGNDLYNRMIEKRYFAQAPTQGSGEFVNVLSNVLNKSVALGWQTAPTTFENWVGTGSLADFKTADLVRLSEYGDVERIREGEAPKMAKMADTKEQTRLETYGSKYILSRQAMVNDDLSQFTTVPAKEMRALRRKMNQLCYGLIYDNNGAGTAFLGPTMLEDNIVLFNATSHTNYVASGGVPTQASLNTAFVAMKNHAALTPDTGRSNTIYMNIDPQYILIGPNYQLETFKLFNNIGYNVSNEDSAALGTNAANIHGPGQPRNLQVIIDAELDNIDASYYPWYLATNPNDVGTVTLYTLNGNTTPYTDAAPTPTGDARGMIWVIEHDFVFAVTDWRGLYCNAGESK